VRHDRRDDPALWQRQLTLGLILTGPLLLYGPSLVRNEIVRAGWRDDGISPPAHQAGDL